MLSFAKSLQNVWARCLCCFFFIALFEQDILDTKSSACKADIDCVPKSEDITFSVSLENQQNFACGGIEPGSCLFEDDTMPETDQMIPCSQSEEWFHIASVY